MLSSMIVLKLTGLYFSFDRTLIPIGLTVGAKGTIKEMELPPFEVEVVGRSYQEGEVAVYAPDGRFRGYETRGDTSLSFRKTDGTKLKSRNKWERKHLSLLPNGDKGLYHPGYPYPLKRDLRA